MVQTRSKARGENSHEEEVKSKRPTKTAGPKAKQESEPAPTETKKRKSEAPPDAVDATPPSPKKSKTSEPPQRSEATEPAAAYTLTPELEKLITDFGTSPLDGLSLASPHTPEPSTLLAHLLHALLTSARISNSVAIKTLHCCIEANYHDLPSLEKSTWDDRTAVLTQGGYTRYREKTATQLGDLAKLLRDKYDGDLNQLRNRAGDDPGKIRAVIKEVKGIGDVGVNIFIDTAQGLWPSLSPFVDPRSLETATQLGVGNTAEELWEGVGKDPGRMARACAGLTRVRLEGRAEDFRS